MVQPNSFRQFPWSLSLDVYHLLVGAGGTPAALEFSASVNAYDVCGHYDFVKA